jgi:hypothetical protein
VRLTALVGEPLRPLLDPAEHLSLHDQRARLHHEHPKALARRRALIEMRLRLIRRVEPSSGESINVHTQSPASESGNDINEALGSVSVEAKYLLQLGDLANEPDLLDLDLTDPSGLASDLELDLSSAPRYLVHHFLRPLEAR